MVESRLNKPLALAAIAVALVLGVLLGISYGIADRIFGGGPDPTTVARSSLQAMRAQNRLVPFVARYVAVVTARQSRFGLSSERTLILPGMVRYEVDLSKLQQNDVQWDASSRTLQVRIPDVEIAGPEVELSALREYGSDGIVVRLTGGENRLNQANRQAAVADLRRQAQGQVPMRLARQAARQAIERSFAMPLRAAGLQDAKVVARFRGEEDTADPSYLDLSTPYNEAIEEARRRRAAEGQR